MRTGAELVRATNPFAQEDRPRSWRLLGVSLLIYAAAVAGTVLAPGLGPKLGFSVLAALMILRLFMFYHDFQHGAILQGSKLARAVFSVMGVWMLNPPSAWKQTHDYHHKNTAKIIGASIGSYPVATTDMWAMMSPWLRLQYRFVRSPANMLLGYLTVFGFGMCLSPFRRNPKVHWDGPLALIVHFGVAATLWSLGGWSLALFTVMLPQALACAGGAYLFYVQHNFPGMMLKGRSEWEYSFAALRSSSMMDLGPVLHWFTGNIGYHHVHHLNHRIPFYRLPEAMAALPELQSPCRSSLHPRDVFAALHLALWDARAGRMLTWDEVSEVSVVRPT